MRRFGRFGLTLSKPVPAGPSPHRNEGVGLIRQGHWDMMLRRIPSEPAVPGPTTHR